MKVIFFGTSEFAIPALQAIHGSKHELAAVVTNPDRPRGRGRKMTAPYGKEEALRLSVPVLQPEKLNKDFFEEFISIGADIGVVAAYGKMISNKYLDAPKYGIINIHPSLLPKYRGPSPIQQPILHGDRETAVTIIQLTPEMDAGPIILQDKVKLKGNENAGRLHDKLAEIGGKLLIKALDLIEKGKAEYLDQDENKAVLCSKIDKEDGCIDWGSDSLSIERHIRAMSPWPGAFTFSEKDGRRIIVNDAHIESIKKTDFDPGTVTSACGKEGLCIATGDGVIKIHEVSPAGSRKMTSAEFVRGGRIKEGDALISSPEQ